MTLERRTPLKRSGRLRRVSRKGAQRERDLDRARAVAKARALGECEARRFSDLCTGAGTMAHHLRPADRDEGRHEPDRLLWVCAFCHSDLHHHRPADARALGLLVPSWGEPDLELVLARTR